MIQLKKLLQEIGDASSTKYKWKLSRQKGADFNVPAPTHWSDDEVYREYTFTSKSRLKYTVRVANRFYGDPEFDGHLYVDFYTGAGSTYKVTNRGEMYSVMATVVDIVKDALNNAPDAKGIAYNPEGKGGDGGEHRDRLYRAYLSKAFPGMSFSNTIYGIVGTF